MTFLKKLFGIAACLIVSVSTVSFALFDIDAAAVLDGTINVSETVEVKTSADVTFSSVLSWLNMKGLTKYSTEQEFRSEDSITRGETAKFVSQYAAVVGFEGLYSDCTFTDIADYDSTLVPHIQTACQLGILKGSKNMFMPNDTLTEAQAVTLVVRTLFGFQDETVAPWYKNYYELGKAVGLITTESLESVNETPITRAKLGTWFYLAAELALREDMHEENAMLNDKDTMNDEMMNSSVTIDVTGENYAFSVDTIEVTEGQTVTINFESTDGFHDWVVDEFNAATEKVNPGTPTSVTFVADKVGEFEFYCSVGQHRANGMTGKLIVKSSEKVTNEEENMVDTAEDDTETQTTPQGVMPYSEEALELALDEEQNVVLFFSADRCPLCQALTADLDANAESIPESLVILTIDYDSETELKQEYNIISQHTLVYLDADGEVYFDSVKTATTLEELIDEMESNM